MGEKNFGNLPFAYRGSLVLETRLSSPKLLTLLLHVHTAVNVLFLLISSVISYIQDGVD